MATIYKRKSRTGKGYTWRAVIPLPGKKRLCKSFNLKETAKEWIKETEYKLKYGSFDFQKHKTTHTFKDLVDRFIADGMLEHYRSKRDAIRHLDYFCKRFGPWPVTNLSSDMISDERKLLVTTPMANGKLRANATINRYTATLSAIFSYACTNLDWMIENPCIRLIKLKEPPARNRQLTPHEMTGLLKEAKKSRNSYLYCFILMGFVTGARRGEILSLKWENVDLNRGCAHIPESKNGSARTVPLPPLVVEELKKIHERRNPAKRYVFASKRTFGIMDIKKSWYKALKEAGITDMRFHDIRHHYATEISKKGASAIALKTGMGHRTLQMVVRYTHPEAEMTRKFGEEIALDIQECTKNEV